MYHSVMFMVLALIVSVQFDRYHATQSTSTITTTHGGTTCSYLQFPLALMLLIIVSCNDNNIYSQISHWNLSRLFISSQECARYLACSASSLIKKNSRFNRERIVLILDLMSIDDYFSVQQFTER